MKKIIPLLLCGLIILSGCGDGPKPSVSGDPADVTLPSVDQSFADITLPTSDPEVEPLPPTEEYVYRVPTYSYAEPSGWSRLFECESGTVISGTIGDDREDYSGSGYLTTDGSNAVLTLTVEIPAPQHYNITVRAAADQPASGSFWADGGFTPKTFALTADGGYETLRYDNVYLPAGEITLIFGSFSGTVDLDCILFEESEEIETLNYTVSGGLSNQNSSDSAKALYDCILSNYGKKVLSGQQCSQGSNAEIDAIYDALGRYPAIRFGELSGYSDGEDTGDIELAIEWAEAGGIVGYSWYWLMNNSVYLGSGFELKNAVTDLDIASMDGGALSQRFQDGDITAETLLVIDGIDLVAAQLKRLCELDIPVIFRPLPEAGNGVFWWGSDPESYLWLYKLIYDRLDFFHGLDNLIWVYNGQSAEFYPGDDKCDLISLDLYYPDGEDLTQSGINFLLAARGISTEKPIALSECGALPLPDNLSKDKCLWSYCSVWSGDYAETDGVLSEKYISRGAWRDFYSCDIVVTRDEIEYVR